MNNVDISDKSAKVTELERLLADKSVWTDVLCERVAIQAAEIERHEQKDSQKTRELNLLVKENKAQAAEIERLKTDRDSWRRTCERLQEELTRLREMRELVSVLRELYSDEYLRKVLGRKRSVRLCALLDATAQEVKP